MADPVFRILKISTTCDIPLRNSRDKFILGPQTIWEDSDKDIVDGTHGSLFPIAFPYDFTSPIPSSGALTMTLQPSSSRSLSGHYRLSGHIDGNRVLESDLFDISSTNDISVTVKIVLPQTRETPFSWAGDCLWKLEVDGQVDEKIGATFPAITRLELYWIAGDIHDLFLSGNAGIAVDFLRAVIPNLNFAGLGSTHTLAAYDPWSATTSTFNNFSKTYDTISGTSYFVISNYNTPQYGGVFYYNYYIAAQTGGSPGSLAPYVNCYDQAAMVQVVNSFGALVPDRPSWLYMQPFGYITSTYLVGVPGLCNNPFFMSNLSPQLIGINDTRRWPFGNHVFNGKLATWSPTTDQVFDACGGPHLGDNPLSYVSYSIDRETMLYTPQFQPGLLINVVQCVGVTGTQATSNAMSMVVDTQPGGKGLDTLIQRATSNHPRARTFLQCRWDDVPSWLNSVIDSNATIAFRDVHLGHDFIQALWHLTGIEGIEGGSVVLEVKIHTPTGSAGDLDLTQGAAAALHSFRSRLTNVHMDLGPESDVLNTIWEPAAVALDYAQHAVQLASHITRGRILIISGNTTISISGGSSSASLEPFLRKVLSHTTIEQPIPLSIPRADSTRFNIPTSRRGNNNNVVIGIGTSFSLQCEVPHPISFASIHSESRGVILDGYSVHVNPESDSLTTINFHLVTWKLGVHEVELRFSRKETLTEGIHKVNVEVVEA